jgi:DNA-binding IclR family transcriptional regulator
MVSRESAGAAHNLADWKFITNHAQVLLCVAHDPEIRLREIAEACGITERAAHRIIADLEEAGYITRERMGRRNRYEFHPEVAMRHPRIGHALLKDIPMGDLVAPLMASEGKNGAPQDGAQTSAASRRA